MAAASQPGVRAWFDTLTCVVFFGAIVTAGVLSVLPIASVSGDPERGMAGSPLKSFTTGAWGRVPEEFRSYFDKAFAFRRPLVQWHGMLWVKGLRSSSSSQVVLGKGGRLFFTGDNAMLDFRNVKPFKEAELATWASTLERRRKWLEARGCRYLFVVVPNSQTIYPEMVPPVQNRVRETSRLDQVLAYMGEHTGVEMLDLRPALRRARAERNVDVYHRTDTHWNQLGAYEGYRELIGALGVAFPRLRPRPESDFRVTRSRRPGGDLARLLGLQDQLGEEVVGMDWTSPRRARLVGETQELQDRNVNYEQQIVSECADGEISRLVMLRDSQASALIPFLSEHARRAVYVWTDGWDFDCELIRRERPTIVIEEIVERKLMREPPPGAPCESSPSGAPA